MTARHTNNENIDTESSFPMKIGKHYRLLTYRMARQVKLDGFKANRMPKFVCQQSFHSKRMQNFLTKEVSKTAFRGCTERSGHRQNLPSTKRWYSI